MFTHLDLMTITRFVLGDIEQRKRENGAAYYTRRLEIWRGTEYVSITLYADGAEALEARLTEK